MDQSERINSNSADAMVRDQIAARGVKDPRVLDAMRRVPRAAFLPEGLRESAFEDRPLPIGEGQTISQPYMVACMTEILSLRPTDHVLEIGTGSGYQTAVLAELCEHVVSIERHEPLARQAAAQLERLGYRNIEIHSADGSLGWSPSAPYDAILVTAAAPTLPPDLLEQLGEGGRLACPVGTRELQELLLVRRERGQLRRETHTRCVFVPLVGGGGWPDS